MEVLIPTRPVQLDSAQGRNLALLRGGAFIREHLPQRLQGGAPAGVATGLRGGVQLAPGPGPASATPVEGFLHLFA